MEAEAVAVGAVMVAAAAGAVALIIIFRLLILSRSHRASEMTSATTGFRRMHCAAHRAKVMNAMAILARNPKLRK
jgi:hypothetical protein